MATNPPADLTLTPLNGPGRTVEEWLTVFHVATVVLDPYTNESAWILPTAARILRGLSGSAVRVSFLLTCDADGAKQFLGPLADEFLVFTDPDRTAVKGLGLGTLPAFVFVRQDGTTAASAEGWDPTAWRNVAKTIATTVSWSTPTIPAPTDPAPYAGTAALG